MGDFLKFKKMITPTIMQVLFWVGVVVAFVGGLATVISSFYLDVDEGAGFYFIAGLIAMFLGPVFVRIYCELIISFFRMNENLIEIKESLAKK